MDERLCGNCGWEMDYHGHREACVYWDHKRGYVHFKDRRFVQSEEIARP